MGDDNSQKIVKYTLESYIGRPISEIETNERQKEAIERLMNLREDKFQELCYDVSNEIHKRNGMKYDVTNKMSKRFSMLTEKNFKNLVVDLLVVYYRKNPNKKPETMPVFLNSLEDLIETLKSESANESFIKKIEGLGLYHKIQEMIYYIRRNIGEQITEELEQILDYVSLEIETEIGTESCKFFEALSYPEIFVNNYLSSKYCSKLCDAEVSKVKAIKEYIQETIRLKEPNDLTKNKMCDLMKLIIDNVCIPAKHFQNYEKETKYVIESLENIKDELTNKTSMDISKALDKLDTVIERFKETDFNNEIDHYKPMFKEMTKKINNTEYCDNKLDIFKTILHFAKDFSTVLSKQR